jgi:hypothetical protein
VPVNAVEARAPPKGVIQNVGQIVALIEKGLGITSLEDQIDAALGGSLVSTCDQKSLQYHSGLRWPNRFSAHQTAIEDALGITKAEKALGLEDGKIPDGVLEKVLGLVKTLDDSLGVTTLEDELDGLLGGNVSAIEDKLGLTYLETLLGIE